MPITLAFWFGQPPVDNRGSSVIEYKGFSVDSAGGRLMDDVFAAHSFSNNHMEMLKRDSVCGCFYCRKIFNPNEITEWIPEKSGTALCPYCGIDSVIGESSGFPIAEQFLNKMNQYWFG
jgi:hypothetical protein